MNTNKYYDPFSAIVKSYDAGEKNLFDKTDMTKIYIVKLNDNEKIPVNKKVFKIGTKSELCDYIITNSKYVGRYHARLVSEGGRTFFEDNNSTNKSYVNNKQVYPNQKVPLKDGDEIKLANVCFRFVCESY